MGWFSKSEKSEILKEELKRDIYVRCPKCKAHVYKSDWEASLKVCSKCNHHGRISCTERLQLLIDENTFKEIFSDITPNDALGFKDGKGTYRDKIRETMDKTQLKEAVITGRGKLEGRDVVIAIMDFRFLGGSLGSGTGEKIFQAANFAAQHKLPYIIVSASGGARMQEGMLSLMQMAKTCAGIARLKQEKLPYISILTDPTSGGVSASYAMMGDVNIAEPGALIAFAGRRVIEQTIKQKLPDNFQTAEYLLEQGFIDYIIERKEMKSLISRILEFYNGKQR